MSTLEDEEFETVEDDGIETLADENEFARICLYGKWGTGKTTAMASAARLGKLVHIDAEKRLKPGPLRRLGIPTQNIQPFRKIEFEAMQDLVWDVKKRLYDDENSVAAIGLDGFNETTKLLVGHVLTANAEKLQAIANRRGEVAPDFNPYAIDRDMWGEMTEQLRQLLRHMRDLPCHLVFTSHERRDLDDDGAVTIGPAATPAAQADLMGYVDIVGHTYVEGGQYLARFGPGTKYQAKDTFGVLPKVMVNPTVDRIVAYVREELTPETDEQQLAYEARRRDQLNAVGDAVLASGGERPRRRSRSASA